MALLGDFGSLRLLAFFGIFIAVLLLETLLPRRSRPRSLLRMGSNFALSLTNSLMLKLLAGFAIPFAAVSAALYAEQAGWGLLNQFDLPFALELLIALVLLDLAIYGQHVAAHLVPLLWRFHKVHHSDIAFDVTTAIRFHPIEILISMTWKIILALLLGPSVLAVILFEIILNGCAMFNHANLRLPLWLDRLIRLFLVTPDMHRVHHSTIPQELNSNYGFSISLWDRLFRTYTPQPSMGHENMEIGLKNHQDRQPISYLWSLQYPFMREQNKPS